VKTREEIDARKEKYGAAEVVGLLKGMSKLLVAKGKKISRIDLKKERPDDKTLVALMLGPTGNLRAPTMKIGKTVLVGFNDELYSELFD
jgi:arsenate reductase-like glutaredoxin family protein